MHFAKKFANTKMFRVVRRTNGLTAAEMKKRAKADRQAREVESHFLSC